jgi:hypothetical protein
MDVLEKVLMAKETSGDSGQRPQRPDLPPEAKRALAEAEERRRLATLAQNASAPKLRPKPKEVNGPQGPEPTRYGDWERKGIASDF